MPPSHATAGLACCAGPDAQEANAQPQGRYRGLQGEDIASEASAHINGSLASSTQGSPNKIRSIASYLHVLHSQRATTDLDDETFQALVDYQLTAREPIRAPWFRPNQEPRVRGPASQVQVALHSCRHAICSAPQVQRWACRASWQVMLALQDFVGPRPPPVPFRQPTRQQVSLHAPCFEAQSCL